ncbi:hypothetical protein R1flu_000679 [Riccia fluitans]|uniref:Uncharacterized protein n=1 Tax=Riccia fluitans TaxID=41844 RepID=A0ABD1Y143_9MARC
MEAGKCVTSTLSLLCGGRLPLSVRRVDKHVHEAARPETAALSQRTPVDLVRWSNTKRLTGALMPKGSLTYRLGAERSFLELWTPRRTTSSWPLSYEPTLACEQEAMRAYGAPDTWGRVVNPTRACETGSARSGRGSTDKWPRCCGMESYTGMSGGPLAIRYQVHIPRISEYSNHFQVPNDRPCQGDDVEGRLPSRSLN